MPLDFARAADLFCGTEDELAMALHIDLGDLRHFRTNPQRAPKALLASIGRALVERGNGMKRVGEMLMEEGSG